MGGINTAIGLPPSGTIKVSQMPKVRARATDKDRDAKRQASASKESARAAKRAAKARSVEPAPCPRRVLLTAALDGDMDARWTVQQLFGDGWRSLARMELGR